MNILFVDSTSQFQKESTKGKSVLDSEKRAFAAKAWRAKKRQKMLAARQSSVSSVSSANTQQSYKSQNSPSPTNVLARGNSDPFRCVAIELDPMMSSHITLMRDVVTPAHFDTPIVRACSGLGMTEPRGSPSLSLITEYSKRKYWKNATAVLYDEGPAASYKVVASGFVTGGVGWVTKPWTSVEELEMRSRAILALRRALEKNTPDSDYATFQQFYFLIKLEIATSNYEDSLLHRQTLRRAVEGAFENNVLNVENFTAIGLAVMDMAPKAMQRPIFDVDIWCEKIFSSLWCECRSMLKSRGISRRKGNVLHSSINVPSLQAAFLEAWMHIDTAQAMATSLRRWPKEDEDQVYMYILTTSHVTSGRLVNLYLDLSDDRVSQLSFADMQSFQRHFQSCLALALLYCLRILEHECIVKDMDIRDVGDSVMSHVHSTFQYVSSHPDATRQEHTEALLWISFIGTIYELRKPKNSTLPYTRHSAETFLHHFQAIASELGISTSRSLIELSKQFFYTEYLLPVTTDRFEDILLRRSSWT